MMDDLSVNFILHGQKKHRYVDYYPQNGHWAYMWKHYFKKAVERLSAQTEVRINVSNRSQFIHTTHLLKLKSSAQNCH